MLSVIYADCNNAEGLLYWVLFILSVIYVEGNNAQCRNGECQLWWVLFMKSVIYSEWHLCCVIYVECNGSLSSLDYKLSYEKGKNIIFSSSVTEAAPGPTL